MHHIGLRLVTLQTLSSGLYFFNSKKEEKKTPPMFITYFLMQLTPLKSSTHVFPFHIFTIL